MINARELRIGNCAIIGRNGEMITVDANDIVKSYDDSSWLLPIKLTPEILESAGFEWETTAKKHLQFFLPDQDINKRSICFLYLNGECKVLQLYMSDYSDGYFEIKPPKHIHQLQNLYFALTNTELEINLKTITQCQPCRSRETIEQNWDKTIQEIEKGEEV